MVSSSILFTESILFVQHTALKHMNCVKHVYLYCRGMDSQFTGGPLPPDKHAKDVPFLDKYALERWEVGCFVFSDPIIFDCQKHYYLVVCLTTILRVNCLKFINLHNFFLVQSVSVYRYVSVFCSDFSVCSSFYGGFYRRNRGSQ